ncbi:MAG: MFS transporter [bacterium]
MRYGRSFWMLVVCDGLLAAGYALSLPFLAIYLTEHRGLPAGLVGLFLSFSMLTTAVAQALGGEWSDIKGRKKVMVISLLSRGFLIALMAAVMSVNGHYVLLILLHVTGGFVGSFFNPAAKGWVADFVPSHKRMRAYGLLRIGINSGWAVGPALGGFLALKSYPLMFYLTAAAYTVSGLIVLCAVRDSPHKRPGEKLRFKDMASVLSDRRFAVFCLHTVTIAAVMSQLVVGLSLHCVRYVGLSEREVGLLFSLNGAVVVALQYWVSGLLGKARITAGMALGCLFYFAGYVSIGFAPAFLYVAAGVFILTLGETAVSPGMHALAANMAPSGCKGRFLGVQGVAQQLGASLGILIGSNGIQFLSPYWTPAPWCLVGIMAVSAGAGFFSLRKRLTEHEDGIRKEDTVESKVMA